MNNKCEKYSEFLTKIKNVFLLLLKYICTFATE